ncbi:MAG: hypothetical protein ACI4XM_01295 [Candidatus Coprovivens sp.]
MNAKQIGEYLEAEHMHLEHVSYHILLFKRNEVIKVFHSLSQVESYLKKQGYIPNKYYDSKFTEK